MLKHSKEIKFLCFSLFLFFSTITLSLSANVCTEQWSEIDLDKEDWIYVGDVNYTTSDDILTFKFGSTETKQSSSNIVGAVWHKYDFSQKKGLLISFKPTVTADSSYEGNLKYPQGFAIVFTSSSIENLVGEKGSGIGYEGIMNAIAFEFDFVRNAINGDEKYPHFSVHYNISGQISTSSKNYDQAYKLQCINKPIPNFYDGDLDLYYKNIIFEIQIVGKKLIVRSNRDPNPIVQYDFTPFQQLLEQEDVHIGITSSMNKFKTITITDLKVSEVSSKDKGVLELKNSATSYKAGEDITLAYAIQSICGIDLKIYLNQYNETDFVLKINNIGVKPNSINFNDETSKVEIVVTENYKGTYTAVVEFLGQVSSPAKFKVTANDVVTFEICGNDKKENPYNITLELEREEDYFIVPLCAYDQFGNQKKVPGIVETKIKYPNNIIAVNMEDSYLSEGNKELRIKVPISNFGIYEIFNKDFIEEKIRYYELMPKRISPEKSDISILYGYKLVQEEDTEISLRIKARDEYGRDIPTIILEKLNCDFSQSSVTGLSSPVRVSYQDDSILLTVDKPTNPNKYTFVPKVTCDGIDETELNCGYDSVTKLNNCEFYLQTNTIDEENIKVYSDYLDTYITYNKINEGNNPLIISLDEADNKKLTEVYLLDSKQSIYFSPSDKKVTAILDGEDDLTVKRIGNKFVLMLPQGKTRADYTPIGNHNLSITVGGVSYTISVYFYFLDDFMSNVNIVSDTQNIEYIAFYKQISFTLEASETLLLFNIFEKKHKYLGDGESLQKEKVALLIDGKETINNEIIKYSSFISVINHDLTKAGIYKLNLTYNNEEITILELEIKARNEAYYLADEKGNKLSGQTIDIDKDELLKYTLLDKYGNVLTDNQVFSAFAKIKNLNKDIFMIKPNYDGKIHIFNKGITSSTSAVKITLEGGAEYSIKSKYAPSLNEIDPLNSYGILDSSLTPILDKNTVKIYLVLKDKYGNSIQDKNLDESTVEKINVYMIGDNLKEVKTLTSDRKYINANNGYLYSLDIEQIGDFEIKIFYDNYPVECKACHFRYSPDNSFDNSKSIFNLLGNKMKIPVRNNYNKDRIKAALVNKNNNNFIFYYEQRDEYLNEVKDTKSISFTLVSMNKNVNTGGVSINSYGTNEDEKGYFKISSYGNLKNGLYNITKTTGEVVFNIYLTDSFRDSTDSTPTVENSMILLKDKTFYGKTDIPGSFILDLRTKNYLRLKNLDKDLITIKNCEEFENRNNIEVVEGPEDGLLTIFLKATKPGIYNFTVYYNDKPAIDEVYTYICNCGFEKKLTMQKNEAHSSGNYVFFNLVDSNGNQCYKGSNLKEFSKKEYTNYLLKAVGKNNNYKTETFYNHITNTLVVYLDRHVSGLIEFSSNLINIEDSAKNVELTNYILDENHFSVKKNGNSLDITTFDDNYKSIDNTGVSSKDFDVALIRIVNDDFVTLRNGYIVSNGLTVDISSDDDLIDAQGNYLYIVYYKGKEIFCHNCLIEFTENKIDIAKTKIYHKEGNDLYKQNTGFMILPLSKSHFPFFKINLMTEKNNLAILSSGLSATIEIEGNILSSNIKYASNGNIYVYLDQAGRKAFLNVKSMEEMTLSIGYSDIVYKVSYYILDHYVNQPSSTEYCSLGAIPNIVSSDLLFIKRADEELEVELYLSGCGDEEKNIIEKLTLTDEGGNTIQADVIPTDIYGGYLLFLPTSLGVTNSAYYYISNKKSKSKRFELVVMPGYKISSMTFKPNNKISNPMTDKLYFYFFVHLKDEKGNDISNIGRNLFANDIFGIDIGDLPYKLMYNENEKAFICQVPINGTSTSSKGITISSPLAASSLKIEINAFEFYENSLVEFSKEENNQFYFNFVLKDDYYAIVETSKYVNSVSFKYFTVNPMSDELFIREIYPNIEGNTFVVYLDESYPKYSIYGFIPQIGKIPQVCPSCLKINEFPNYIYSKEVEGFLPHNFENLKFLIKDLDKPTYIYLAHKTINISPNGVSKEIINNDKLKLYLLTNIANSNKVDYTFSDGSNSKKLKIDFIDYSQTKEIPIKTVPDYIERYSYNIYNRNNLDNIELSFFIEIRSDEGQLISTTPTLYIEKDFEEIIKRIVVINTCYTGVYFVKISFLKSVNNEFHLQFNYEQNKDKYNAIQLNIEPAFPYQIVLNNKETINERMIRYDLFATNSNAEQICDDRLNLYIDDSYLKSIKKKLIYSGEICSLYIQFYGVSAIKSNIEANFTSEINNDLNSIYNVNPQFSSISISPNVYSGESVDITITFKEKSPSLTSYNENEVIGLKKLNIYKYISPNKIKSINSFSSLYASKYTYSQDEFNLKQGNIYVIAGTILDNIISPSFINYKADKVGKVESISGEYYNSDKKSLPLSNFSDKTQFTEKLLELDLPFLLRVKFTDSNGITLDFAKDVAKVSASIIYVDNNKIVEGEEIELIVRQFNDNYFFMRPDTNKISTIKHLASKFSNENSGYFIKIVCNDKTFYSLLSLKKNCYHDPHPKEKYDSPLNMNNTDIVFGNEKAESSFDIHSKTESIHQICLFVNSKKNIINKHIDPYEVSLSIDETDCENFSYANSYMGCLEFSINCNKKENYDINIIYNGKTSKPSLRVLDNSKITLSDRTPSNFTEGSTVFSFILSSSDEIKNYDFYRVYINGEKLKKFDYTFPNEYRIDVSSSFFSSIQPNKNFVFVYDNGLSERYTIAKTDIYVVPKVVDNKNYKYTCQDPFNLKAGDNIAFYLNIKDIEFSACYYGLMQDLSDIVLTTKLDSGQVTAKITDRIQLNNYSECEYIYYVDFKNQKTTAGDLEIKMENNDFNCKLHISAQDIDPSKSLFSSASGKKGMTAGETMLLYFAGTDKYSNNINYYDLFKIFDIKLTDSDGNDIEKKEKNYSYKIRVSQDNTKLLIDLKINIYGIYTVNALINEKVMTLQNVFKINVGFGACSLYDANPRILPIDRRETYYSGETITIKIKCKDSLGNQVIEQGKEIFLANIKKENETISYSYNKTFSGGEHAFTFTPPTVGNYSIDISLNGKKYGKTLDIEILAINSNLYNCLDKRQVENIEECDNDNYRLLVKDILGENYVAADDDIKEGKLFVCPSNDTEAESGNQTLVAHTKDCGCPKNTKEWNGFCYMEGSVPSEQINSNKITCITKMKIKDVNTNYTKCGDGSCRYIEDECKTKFECPIGFIPCGVKCILLNETCNEQNTCSNDQVLCWDLTCAEGYDLCPTRITCPKNKVLCPDGSCQESGHCIQPVKRNCEKSQYQCPDFSCVESRDDCPKHKVCEPGFSLCENGECRKSCQDIEVRPNEYRCSNGLYVENIQLCPSEMYVPPDYVKCPNGGIALDRDSCDFVQPTLLITCPRSKPILCPDFACVSKSNDCSSNIPICPPHKPYKCWNNECRNSIEECPTPTTCPADTPILCQNGLCMKSGDECTERGGTTCPQYRCYDGTCVASIELCPTHPYCGEDKIKCWNGACVSDISECLSTNDLETCPSTLNYRCPDGTCRKSASDCSTISVCPPHLPIKCFDNSCRANINECPIYQSCGSKKKSCPDGTCASSFEECNTVVTCTSSKPFLCYDNLCKPILSECAEPPHCSKNEVLCPNGACSSSRQNCKFFEPCDANNPTRCELNTCTNDVRECESNEKRCPIGYILCPNGDCKRSEYLCDEFQCPKNKPYFCSEGVCVHDKALCDNPVNGCPYNMPYKCASGNCVEKEKDCEDFSCSEGKILCPDGSCLDETKKGECPLANGCYKDRPFKCADGTCINPETSTCSIALCKISKPYKCPNGHCVAKSSECATDLNDDDLGGCKDGLIMCIDGRCVESSDYCRPDFECESGYSKCPDGTCRVTPDLCPENINCPLNRIRCQDSQICVKDENECKYGLICPSDYTKCKYDGLCTKAPEEECEVNPILGYNGCINGGEKCPNGRCMKHLSECSLINNACPDDSKPYLCSNGECIDNILKCPHTDTPGECIENKVRCPTGRCIEDDIKKKREECSNIIGCPLNKPYRCSNGVCVENERICDVTTIVEGALISNVACDASKPYLCRDRSCVSDPSFCKSITCPFSTHKICFNGFCIDKENGNCTDFEGYCPIVTPIHCPSGTCADDYIKCSSTFTIPTCGEGEFYCSRLNKCLINKLDCFIFYEEAIKGLEKNNEQETNLRRLLEPKEEIISFKEEDNPERNTSDDIQPDPEIVKLELKPCYDGTFVSKNENCSIVPACKMGQYRCENGGCSYDPKLCVIDEEYKCSENRKKCPDGLCHEDCSEVLFNGCEVGKYQCTNGQCVNDKYDCIGHSMCYNEGTPFRCINGDCKSSPEECELIQRLGSVKNITYSFNKYNKIDFSFAYDTNRRPIAKIQIPGSGLKFDGNYSKLYIREIASSILYKSEFYNNTAEFLYNISNSIYGSEGVLNFENSVMSPIFKFDSFDRTMIFKINATINIEHNEYEASGLNYYDYCLAKLDNFNMDIDIPNQGAKWVCVERQTTEGQTQFGINEFGVYAVILNPLRDKINYFGNSKAKNFFLENVKFILIVLAVVIVVVALVFYIFLRVSRYRQKYHENRAKILLLQQQKQEYENMTTDIFGQTLGDNINGIVYKSNPAYTVSNEIKKSGSSLEEDIEKLQIECRNVDDQNERLQKDIADITEKYKTLSATIENMNK